MVETDTHKKQFIDSTSGTTGSGNQSALNQFVFISSMMPEVMRWQEVL